MKGRPNALITGASAGLGASFARLLAEKGYDLVLVARRGERLRSVGAEIADQTGCSYRVIEADLADASAPEDIFAATQVEGLAIDYLVNNAGVAGPDLLNDRQWLDQARFFQLMMIAIAHLCHLYIPGMVERQAGHVINVASVAGRITSAGGCNYGPTKSYVIAMSDELGLTLRDTGVNVLALCPGFTHTEFHEVAGLEDMKAGTPDFLWYDADTVVAESLHAVERGKRVLVSGRLYRWLDPLMRSVITRRLFHRRR
ncbi:MAG: short-chain dehydrogenase [OM182 bacterium MED-G24]|uniref:Short-chain dehydrogenase n=1 Tax=OM182 bacterium MED-G24 TaxID=1986255 RepID=A0A2A5WRU7_9GAMM|nr:MAG: short-chain dehydrogenase [OM182 bacterium MED-G24]|tara:strand:- start:2556 stop:3326 length:771 start_codon:yes stop_codon:yes gene_type:complete